MHTQAPVAGAPLLPAEPVVPVEQHGVPVAPAEPPAAVVAPAVQGPLQPRPAASPAPAPPAAAPVRPPVVIERIEIVTPPARPLPADPLASIADRRAARSRHGVAG